VQQIKNPILLMFVMYFAFYFAEMIIQNSFVCNTVTQSAPCWLQNNYYIALVVFRFSFFLGMSLVLVVRCGKYFFNKMSN
jgi:hypothetical protein